MKNTIMNAPKLIYIIFFLWHYQPIHCELSLGTGSSRLEDAAELNQIVEDKEYVLSEL